MVLKEFGECPVHAIISRILFPQLNMEVELVWSSGKGLSPLVIMEGKLDRWGYVDILEKHLLPYIQQNFKGKGYNFRQDNAPIYRAKDVTN